MYCIIVAQAALGLHIFHGTWSLFQTLGINNRRFNSARRALAIGDLSPPKGGGSGVTSRSHSQMHSFTHPRGSPEPKSEGCL